jgi:hypothetical protein
MPVFPSEDGHDRETTGQLRVTRQLNHDASDNRRRQAAELPIASQRDRRGLVQTGHTDASGFDVGTRNQVTVT